MVLGWPSQRICSPQVQVIAATVNHGRIGQPLALLCAPTEGSSVLAPPAARGFGSRRRGDRLHRKLLHQGCESHHDDADCHTGKGEENPMALGGEIHRMG